MTGVTLLRTWLWTLRISALAWLVLAPIAVAAVLEAAVRLLGVIPIGPRIFSEQVGYPGYALRPNISATYFASGRRIDVSVDLFARRLIKGALIGGRELHLVGGAQAFGWNLTDDETIGQRLQQRLGPSWRVVVDAVPGFGPYEMLNRIEEIPVDHQIVLLLSEADDLRALQATAPLWTAACGYIVPITSLASQLPCPLLASRIVAWAVAQATQAMAATSIVPLAHDKHARSAASVLRFRLTNLVNEQRRARGRSFLVATIPWFSVTNPRTDATQFPDDVHLDEWIAGNPARYFDQNLLNAEGTDLIAGMLADRLTTTNGERSRP